MKPARARQSRGDDDVASSPRATGQRSMRQAGDGRASRRARDERSATRTSERTPERTAESCATPRRRVSASTTSKPLPPGTRAPGFCLHSTPDQVVNLSDFRGRPVVMAFYPADWSPVCGDELALFNEVLPEFERYNAQLLGISVDGPWCHVAYARDRKLHFPLLADFEPKGEVARKYGVYRQDEGVSERALFLIDENGVIRWSYVSPMGVNPGADGALRALEALHPEQAESAQQSQRAMEVQHA
jgi:peroxiredoxin